MVECSFCGKKLEDGSEVMVVKKVKLIPHGFQESNNIYVCVDCWDTANLNDILPPSSEFYID